MSFKLKVVEYFDSVINEIDLYTEKEILARIGDERVEQLLNKRRQVLLSKVNEIQQHCLRQIEQLEMQDDEMNNNKDNEKRNVDEDGGYAINEKVFSKFCFTHSYVGLVYLFAVDYYVSSREIERFKACLWPSEKELKKDEESQLLIEILDPRLRTSEAMKDKPQKGDSVSVKLLEAYKTFGHFDSPVIHVTKPFQLERMSISGPIKVAADCMMMNSRRLQKSENKLVRVGLLVIGVDYVSEDWESLERLVDLNVRLDQLSIEGKEGLDKEKFDRLVSRLPRGKGLFERVSLKANYCDWSSMEQEVDSIQEFELKLNKECSIDSVFESLRNLKRLESLFINEAVVITMSHNSKNNKSYDTNSCKYMLTRDHLRCVRKELKSLRMRLPTGEICQDALTDLESLRFFHLDINETLKFMSKGEKRFYNWSFIDSVRDKLETLILDTPWSVPSALLRDMPKLKELEIHCQEIEYNAQSYENENAQLLTGLNSLERLDIRDMRSGLFFPRHFAHLTSLQHLVLDAQNAPLITLFSHQTSQDSLSSTSTHLANLFNSLRTLKLQFTSFGHFCPRPFSRLTNLTSLELTCKTNNNDERVTRDLFYGLDSLTHLKVNADRKYQVNVDTLAHLHQLQDLNLSNAKQHFQELKENGAFDECKSINRINMGNGWTNTPKTVYMDKLDRFVVVIGL